MYTRNTRNTPQSRTQRYDPPPGYTGSTFSMKHHPPTDEIDEQLPRVPENETDGQPGEPPLAEDGIRGASNPPDTNPLTCTGEDKNEDSIIDNEHPAEVMNRDRSPVAELIDSLRGRIGTEELIILAVMLLISSDGMCAEVLILALCLIAG